MAEETDKTTHRLRQAVLDDLEARSEWNRRDDEILRRRLGKRPLQKTRPYLGAPNFVEMIVDDAVREKTDQEVSMLFNAPRVACVAALATLPGDMRQRIEAAFDSYVRYVIRARRKIEQAMDTKNARGFAFIKNVRTYNELLDADVPDIEVVDNKDIVIPADTTDIRHAERICHIIRLTEREFLERAEARGWRNAQDVLDKAKTEQRSGESENDSFDTTKDLIGLTTSAHAKYVIVWELYHYATEEDVAEAERHGFDPEIQAGRRCVTTFCADAPELPLAKMAWKEADTDEPLPPEVQQAEIAMAQAEQRPPILTQPVSGKDRKWPVSAPRFEERSAYLMDSRGGGHLCMDDQIAATQLRNMQATMAEFYLTPLFKRTVGHSNSANVSFEPGSVLPEGVEPAVMPQISPQFQFDINDRRATAARRLGASGQYNYSEAVGSRRKIEKTATEVDTEQMRAASMSSTSVDRFNEPLADCFQMIWEDIVRMRLNFPIIEPNRAPVPFESAGLKGKILLVPAGSAKTLNPEVQLQKSMMLVQFLSAFAPHVPMDLKAQLQSVLANYDPRLTDGWLLNDQQMAPWMQRMNQAEQDIQQLAQGGKDLTTRTENVERLTVKTAAQADKLERDHEVMKARTRAKGERQNAPPVAMAY